jgi:large subunit ribosomal protein L6
VKFLKDYTNPMSRIGRKPITLPNGVPLSVSGSAIEVKGQKGTLAHTFPTVVMFEQSDHQVLAKVKNPDDRKQRALWGLARALLANMVQGVSQGFEKKLEIQGVGYRAEMKGATLVLHVGFSHSVEFKPPEGVIVTLNKNIITVNGIDKQMVGEAAANIRKVRKPEPYKGKGIRYVDEQVRRKAGKVVKAAE